MMENFAHILQCLLIASGAYSSREHFGGTFPFKVQVNFDIPVFEGQIDADAGASQGRASIASSEPARR
jgi:hypothetical protein